MAFPIKPGAIKETGSNMAFPIKPGAIGVPHRLYKKAGFGKETGVDFPMKRSEGPLFDWTLRDEGPLFDSIESIREADYGKLTAANHKSELLGFFQSMARALARRDVSRECDANRLALHAWETSKLDIALILGNASGSIFKGSDWFFTGRLAKSERVRAHGRDVKVWRLR